MRRRRAPSDARGGRRERDRPVCWRHGRCPGTPTRASSIPAPTAGCGPRGTARSGPRALPMRLRRARFGDGDGGGERRRVRRRGAGRNAQARAGAARQAVAAHTTTADMPTVWPPGIGDSVSAQRLSASEVIPVRSRPNFSFLSVPLPTITHINLCPCPIAPYNPLFQAPPLTHTYLLTVATHDWRLAPKFARYERSSAVSPILPPSLRPPRTGA